MGIDLLRGEGGEGAWYNMYVLRIRMSTIRLRQRENIHFFTLFSRLWDDIAWRSGRFVFCTWISFRVDREREDREDREGALTLSKATPKRPKKDKITSKVMQSAYQIARRILACVGGGRESTNEEWMNDMKTRTQKVGEVTEVHTNVDRVIFSLFGPFVPAQYAHASLSYSFLFLKLSASDSKTSKTTESQERERERHLMMMMMMMMMKISRSTSFQQ